MKGGATLVWGGLLLLLGLGLLGWIAYNLLVERHPATEGRSPVVPAIFGVVLVLTGAWRIRQGLER